MRIVVLCGGVGAARFLDGVVRSVDAPSAVTAICNVSDDLQWHGLHVSPDIDTILYTLAGLEGEFGWGLTGDTHAALEELRTLGRDEWFTIGDRDLATHLWRSEQLRGGATLAEATAALATARGLACCLLPVTNDPHPTIVVTDEGELEFQDYFVRRRSADPVRALRFPGAEIARPAPGVLEAIAEAELILFAPSNPFVSIDPLFAVPGVRAAVEAAPARRVAISPIIGGAAVKGPAADMLRSLGHEVSALGVARLYRGLIDTFVLDEQDRALAPTIAALGLETVVLDSMMRDRPGRARVAAEVLAAVQS
ncbi:MAG: 2-phospho-L-lactate transferase [Chloroflexi bacterium]|nr:2-phospho-L-lactate transferase [Chloroflexota bacterium]MDA1148032.1 2-phospho-L-lactate transferase [Chloroflexota bacterium]